MSKEIKKDEIQKTDLDKLDKIRKSLSNIINKKSKFLFAIPDAPNPIASVYEMYFHASTVKKMGYKVVILVEKDDHIVPNWVDKNLTDFEHISMSDPKLTVGPEDIMVIPEVFSNVMEQTKNLPCHRIGLLQSVDYMTNALIPGMDWSSFGIRDIITTSESIVEWVEVFQGKGKFNIQKYDIGIPDYFKRSETPKKPIISVVGRNANEISKIVKLFYSKYPQYSWVTFDPMLTKSKPPQQMRRVDFAKRLQNNFAAVWVDRISSFGTFPLECMKVGTIPICLKPDITPDYLVERDEVGNPINLKDGGGVWTDNFYDIPVLIADILVKFLDDSIGDKVLDEMAKIAEPYTQENSNKRLTEIYQNHINMRIALFEEALKPFDESEVNEEK
ncbi:MAG: hypothetical protein ACOC2U_01190 [bacterium]